MEAEEHCIEILALQSPVTGDLRQVLAIMKMISDIERSSDLAANICKIPAASTATTTSTPNSAA